MLVVRGAPEGSGADLRRQLQELGGCPRLGVQVREYSARPSRLEQDIRQASLVLMPSRCEGFGLVGLEAIALGRPVLLSAASGLAEVLRELLGKKADQHWVVPVDGGEQETVDEWSRRLDFVLRDRQAAFQRAESLRAALAGKLVWQNEVRKLLAALQ